jgi:hypothetical protein
MLKAILLSPLLVFLLTYEASKLPQWDCSSTETVNRSLDRLRLLTIQVISLARQSYRLSLNSPVGSRPSFLDRSPSFPIYQCLLTQLDCSLVYSTILATTITSYWAYCFAKLFWSYAFLIKLVARLYFLWLFWLLIWPLLLSLRKLITSKRIAALNSRFRYSNERK